MTPQQRRQLQRRVTRIGERLARNKERLDALKDLDTLAFRGRLKEVAAAAIAAGKLKDEDGDGDVQFDDLVDTVVDWLDERVEPDNAFGEWASDVGFEIVGWAAVVVHKNTEPRLGRRIERDEATLVRLQARLKG